MRMPTANQLAQAIERNKAKKPNYPQNPEKRLGTVDASYNRFNPNLPVVFDGEDVAVTLPTTVEASAGDRVTIILFGKQWVVTGVVGAFDWVTVGAFGTGWTNYGGAWENCKYKKNPDGTVNLEGMLRSTIVSPNANPFFTLPAGYRPSYPRLMPIAGDTNRRVIVDTNGNVSLYADTSITQNTGFVSLSGITFLAGG